MILVFTLIAIPLLFMAAIMSFVVAKLFWNKSEPGSFADNDLSSTDDDSTDDDSTGDHPVLKVERDSINRDRQVAEVS